MSTVWKIVGVLSVILLVAGVVCAGIGLLTGASLDRMIENVFDGWDTLELMLDVLKQELGGMLG